MSQYLPVVLLVPAMLLGIYLASRRAQPAPRHMRAKARRAQWITFGGAVVMFAAGAGAGNWLFMGAGALMVASSLFELLRHPPTTEAAANWVYDPGKCGQCGYPLDHVASPHMCPECGWQVPPPQTKAQRADWAMWWKHWTIEHLDQPRRALWMLAINVLMFMGLAAMGVYLEWRNSRLNGWFFIVSGCLMAANLAVNVVRVVQYRRRAHV
jgi:hypothetical protein